MTFKELRVGDQFYFESMNAWQAEGMPKGPFLKTTTRKYRETRCSHLHGIVEHRIGSINAWVIRTG